MAASLASKDSLFLKGLASPACKDSLFSKGPDSPASKDSLFSKGPAYKDSLFQRALIFLRALSFKFPERSTPYMENNTFFLL